MDFLYPEGVPESESKDERPASKVVLGSDAAEGETAAVEVQAEAAPKEAAKGEESVDWLSKFREAAKKFQEEEGKDAAQPEASAEGITGLGAAEEAQEETVSATEASAEKEPASEEGRKFYKSGLGGLKDIAQGIDKTARNAQLPYAFTLNAGLSLYSPIKPFSLLHAYVRPDDLEFYEKSLKLSVSEEGDAQICLFVVTDDGVFASCEELHGLFVVDKSRLGQDIETLGDQALKDEAASVIK
jgi:hypothetical protein